MDVDQHVGATLRALRQSQGVGISALADLLECTPQQVEKYEEGQTRISASKLFAISQHLNVPVSMFYAGLSGERAAEREDSPTVEMLKLLAMLPIEQQQKVLDMARSIARAHAS